ncbi:hypothetical protein Actkin_02174 [Actinokineospora sp. UTMC 2448]|nr:hypothetical protein Actkin_02174 [Actinokineospora sp. UTMC 2448]
MGRSEPHRTIATRLCAYGVHLLAALSFLSELDSLWHTTSPAALILSLAGAAAWPWVPLVCGPAEHTASSAREVTCVRPRKCRHS